MVLKTRRFDKTHNIIDGVGLVAVPGKNSFMFEMAGSQRADDALTVAKSLLRLANDFAEVKGVDFKVVTIPFLSMGQWLFEQELSVEEIQELYFGNGLGHFTSTGHAYFAEATFNCFYEADKGIAIAARGSSGISCLK